MLVLCGQLILSIQKVKERSFIREVNIEELGAVRNGGFYHFVGSIILSETSKTII